MTATASPSIIRHTAHNPCCVCGGYETEKRGIGRRCHGFRGGDGRYEHCSRPEHAGGLPEESSGTYAHRLDGPCQCGRDHTDSLIAIPPRLPVPSGPAVTPRTEPQPKPDRPRPWAGDHPDHIYDYTDAEGNMLYQVLRWDDWGGKKTFMQRRPDPAKPQRPIYGLNGVTPSLYRLVEMIAADDSKPVFVVEGEKCVDYLRERGFTATCNSGGAGKWTDALDGDWWSTKHVVIIPDVGDVDGTGAPTFKGEKHAQVAAQHLYGKAASVKVLKLPGLEKGDVVDWLEQGVWNTSHLMPLAATAPLWHPAIQSSESPPSDDDGSAGTSGDDRAWGDIIPLDAYELPPFPIASLPAWSRNMVTAATKALEVPDDLPAMLFLSVAATALAKRVVVEPRPDYREPLNLWTVTAMEPGERKSATFGLMVEPLEQWSAERAEATRDAIAEAQSYDRLMRKRLEDAEGAAAKADPETRREKEREARELAREVQALRVPKEPRLVCDDSSPEKLSGLLQEHDGRMAIMSPEGDVFDIMAGRYNRGAPNLGVYLKGHSGDALRVDRVSRPSEYVSAPALTMGLAVQPEVLRGLTAKPGFRGRGLLGRFLYSLPKSKIGSRQMRKAPAVPAQIKAGYHDGIYRMLGLERATDSEGREEAWVLRFDDEAQRCFESFADDWLEPQLAPDGRLEPLRDWASKLAGATARIAGILHCVGHYGSMQPWAAPVSADTVASAIEVAQYLIAHAEYAFHIMSGNQTIGDAVTVLNWIKDEGLGSFTKRDVQRKYHRRFKHVDDVDPVLDVLHGHGYIRPLAIAPREERGRPASPAYEVNPAVWATPAAGTDADKFSFDPTSHTHGGGREGEVPEDF